MEMPHASHSSHNVDVIRSQMSPDYSNRNSTAYRQSDSERTLESTSRQSESDRTLRISEQYLTLDFDRTKIGDSSSSSTYNADRSDEMDPDRLHMSPTVKFHGSHEHFDDVSLDNHVDRSNTASPDPEEAMPSTPPPSGPPKLLSEDMSKAREIAFIFVVGMVQVIPQATLGTMFPTSQIVGDYFGITDPGTLPWVIASYALTWGTFILVSGRLGDIFGHKNLVLIGWAWFAFSSLITGLSYYSNETLFFFGRAFQGIGSALLMPNALALLGRTYAPGSQKKNMAFAFFGFMAPTGAWLGMLFGSIFTQLAWWPWMFFTTALVAIGCGVAAQLVLISPPPSPLMLRSFKEKFWDMDWAGAVTGVTGLVCINIAWNCAPKVGWGTQYVYMLLIIGFIIMIGFGIVETKLTKSPLVPFRALKSDVGFVLAAVACGWGCFGIFIYYSWQFLLVLRRVTPLEGSAQFFPVFPLGGVATALTGYLMHNTRPAWILTWALLAFTFGTLLFAIAPVDQTYWGLTFVSLLIIPFGMDMSFPAATVIMSNAVPKDKQGLAGSLVLTVVQYSISLSLGFAATVEVHVSDGGVTEAAILHGYRGAWYMGLGLGVLGIIVCIMYLLRGRVHALKEKRRHMLADHQCEKCGHVPKPYTWRTSGTLLDSMAGEGDRPPIPGTPSIPEHSHSRHYRQESASRPFVVPAES